MAVAGGGAEKQLSSKELMEISSKDIDAKYGRKKEKATCQVITLVDNQNNKITEAKLQTISVNKYCISQGIAHKKN